MLRRAVISAAASGAVQRHARALSRIAAVAQDPQSPQLAVQDLVEEADAAFSWLRGPHGLPTSARFTWTRVARIRR